MRRRHDEDWASRMFGDFAAGAAIFVIDYQPSQIAAVKSMDRDLLLENIVSTVKSAKAFGLPHRPAEADRLRALDGNLHDVSRT